MRAVVLAAGNSYVRQLTVVIKSICSYHRNIKFYILNEVIPKEWFAFIGEKLQDYASVIQDVKLVENEFKDFYIPMEHLNHVAYFRYMIPEVVQEARALYLDSDVLINGDISYLFEVDLEQYSIAAVKEYDASNNFNSGLIVFDVERGRKEGITQTLMKLTAEKTRDGGDFFGDQEILNTIYPEYLVLPRLYNWQPGLEVYGRNEYCMEVEPKVIHYSTSHKPWNTYSSSRFRDLWWYYENLEWSEIKLLNKIRCRETLERKQAFVLTNTADIAHLPYLISSLPDYEFHIAARTAMAPDLLKLAQYQHVYLHPHISSWQIEQLLMDCSCYLDINRYNEVDDIVSRVSALKKPIYAFSDTKHCSDDVYTAIIEGDLPEQMVAVVKSAM